MVQKLNSLLICLNNSVNKLILRRDAMLARYMLWPYVSAGANIRVAAPHSNYPVSTIHHAGN